MRFGEPHVGEKSRRGSSMQERETERGGEGEQREIEDDTSGIHERLMKTCRWSVFPESLDCAG